MRNGLYKVVAGWVLGIGIVHAGVLLAPSGFYAPHLALTARGHAANCPPVDVYQGDLSFPSKYEGNGPAKDTINPEANAEFESLTKPMTKLQQLSASWSDKVFKGKGSAADLAFIESCWLEDGLFGPSPLAERGDAEHTFYGLLALGTCR